ncbi:hypothetical protein VNI00_012706, partial [Paramarasmius palmivorus]
MSFNGSHVNVGGDANNVVHGDQINNVYHLTETESKAFERLAQKAAPNACYDSEQRFPPPNCHEGTRIQMIADISNWIEDDSKATKVLWVHGTAGIGKSAIAQHIAEKYAETRLAAAFFFSRNDSTRDNINPFIASIAYQLCDVGSLSHPMLRSKIIEAVSVNPNVFQASCEVQLRNLIIEPCLRVDPPSWNVKRNLLVIDGLDECVHQPSQKRVLELILRLISAIFPSSWIILLCSRPESQIWDAIEQIRSFREFLKAIDMNKQEGLNRDIARYLSDEFSRIRRERRRVLGIQGAIWPGDNVIVELVRRADKQMIFAVTVIKYIDTRDEPPQKRLERVCAIFVEAGSDSPYSALDTLYHGILLSCVGEWDKTWRILRLLVTPHTLPSLDILHSTPWRSPANIARLVGVQEVEVLVTLDKLHSILRIPNDNEEYNTNSGQEHADNVHIAHATFTEFLGDHCRSVEFYTPEMAKSEYWSIFSLRHLSELADNYPPYHIHSFTDTMLSWTEKFMAIEGPLRTMVLSGWTYWREVTFPLSPDLVDALLTLDIYHFVTLWCQDSFNQYPRQPLHDLKGVIQLEEQIKLAKTQESIPCQFIERLEELDGIEVLNLAFSPDTQGNSVFWQMRQAQQRCWGIPGFFASERVDPFLPYSNTCNQFLLLPPDSSHDGMSVPQNWILASVTKESVELEYKLYSIMGQE